MDSLTKKPPYVAVNSMAYNGTPGDAKCVTKILEGDKNKEVKERGN